MLQKRPKTNFATLLLLLIRRSENNVALGFNFDQVAYSYGWLQQKFYFHLPRDALGRQ
jgi:hypothetical protein